MRGVAVEKRAHDPPVVRAAWLEKVQEDIIEPELPIIDPHHHLGVDRLSGRCLLEELVAELSSGHSFVATVLLQCGWMHR
jgi:L-fuconolactonase